MTKTQLSLRENLLAKLLGIGKPVIMREYGTGLLDKSQMENEAKLLIKCGYEIVSQNERNQGFSLVKTGILGAIFLPLALAGKKKGKMVATYRLVNQELLP